MKPTKNDSEDLIKESNKTTVTISSTWTNVGMLNEWDESCKKEYGDCRWMKMWHDHLFSKQQTVYNNIIEQINELREMIESLKKQSPKEDEKLTLGK